MAAPANGQSNGHGETFYQKEFHKAHDVNRGLKELRRLGLTAADLLPAPRVAGREPPPRFILENSDHKRTLAHLRELTERIYAAVSRDSSD